MNPIDEFLKALGSPKAKELMQGIKEPSNVEEAADKYLALAEKLGFSLRKEDILSFLKNREQAAQALAGKAEQAVNKALDEADLDGVAGGNILEPFKTSKDCRFSNACERTINCFDGPVLLRDGENVETEVCDEPSPIEPMNPKDWKTGCVGDFRH